MEKLLFSVYDVTEVMEKSTPNISKVFVYYQTRYPNGDIKPTRHAKLGYEKYEHDSRPVEELLKEIGF